MFAIVGIGIVDVVDVDEQGMTCRLKNFWDNSQFISREKLDIKFINFGAYNGCLQKSADVRNANSCLRSNKLPYNPFLHMTLNYLSFLLVLD